MKRTRQTFLDEFKEDFYNEVYLEESLEDDQIDTKEHGFMIGYLNL